MKHYTLQEILSDPYKFISRLKIKSKHGKLIPLRLNYEQLKVLEALITGKNVLIIKDRQTGISTIVRAFFFYKTYISKYPISCAVISHKKDSADHLHKMDKTFYLNLPKPLRRELSSETNRTLVFADTKASISSHTAGGDGGLRSFTFTDLHISEFAFIKDADELLATAHSAVNDGQVVIESTANYTGDPLHQEILKVLSGESDFILLQFWWWQHAEYSLPAPSTFQLNESETELQQQYDLTINQLYWRRKQIAKIGLEKFKREYPACIEDAFAQTGNSYYTAYDLQHIQPIQIEASKEHNIFIGPNQSDSYALGVDVASGRGRDYSVIQVLSKKTYQPVAMYRSNSVDPINLAKQIFSISTTYGGAKTLIESNNWGLPVLNELKHMGFTNLWKDDNGKDWETNMRTKLILHEELKAAISEGVIYQLDSITFNELKLLVLDDRGLAPTIPSNSLGHGDAVIALALAYQCLKSVSLSIRPYLPEWIKTKRLNDFKAKGTMGVNRSYKHG